MCFSATASFAVAATTAVIGFATVRQVTRPRELPLAAIPLLFAGQQVVEGALWLQLTGDGGDIAALSLTYLIFAKAVWPVLAPVAVSLIEPDRRRRWMLGAIVGVGCIISVYQVAGLLGEPSIAAIRGHSIFYPSDEEALTWRLIPYFVCTCLPLLLSSHRIIQVFGAVVIVGFLVSGYAYLATFTSVWCFFAAADSTLLYLYFRRAAVARTHSTA